MRRLAGLEFLNGLKVEREILEEEEGEEEHEEKEPHTTSPVKE